MCSGGEGCLQLSRKSRKSRGPPGGRAGCFRVQGTAFRRRVSAIEELRGGKRDAACFGDLERALFPRSPFLVGVRRGIQGGRCWAHYYADG